MAPRTQFSISTMNLFNLNRPGLPVYADRDGWSEAEYAAKIDWTSRQIAAFASDVWGFQELWHTGALEDALAASGLGARYTPLAPPGHAGERIVCAGAVRSDILVGEPEWITDFPPDFRLTSSGDDPQTPEIAVAIRGFSRPVLRFRVRPRADGAAIEVFVCHFKSKGPTQIWREDWYSKPAYSRHADAIGQGLSTIRRTAEATALRMILTEVMKGTDTPVMVIGDINDGHHSNTLNILTGQPRYLLSGLSEGGSDVDLYTVWSLQLFRSERDVYYTHIFQEGWESLDHILVSQEFYDNSRRRQWAFKGAVVANDHLNDDDHKGRGTSDHGIVQARFEYRPRR
jgi:hypothetical protein